MKHYAEYYMPGSFFNEECSRELSDRSVDAAVARAPESAFAFVLYDKADNLPDDTDEYRIVAKRQNVSKRHYLGGKLHNVAEVEALGHDILVSNMRANGWDPVIQTRMGNWQPFKDGDVLVEV